MVVTVVTLFKRLKSHFHTLYLFTRSDFKTIFFPITFFACITGPLSSPKTLCWGMLWIWVHVLQCNVSNQYNSVNEDVVNKPWRPLPSKRISFSNARRLRWLLAILCTAISGLSGREVSGASISLTLTTIIYDELGVAGHWVGKNLCGVLGYTTFEVGATMIIGGKPHLDDIAIRALFYSAFLILTTLHAQDFADVEGDHETGRVTIPILFPVASRIFTLVVLVAWSVCLCYVWELGLLCSISFVGLGCWSGWRYFRYRYAEADKQSYTIYNLWLLLAFVIPINARRGILSF